MIKKVNVRYVLLVIIAFVILPLFYIYQHFGNQRISTATGQGIQKIIGNIDESEKFIKEFKIYDLNEYGLEINIKGATGYSPINMNVKSDGDINSSNVAFLAPGNAFTILEENGEWWYIYIPDKAIHGWVQKKFCMINLPDVIPSIIYNNTNSYNSLFKSSNETIPNVTGKKLYDTYVFNERLNKYTYNMPAMYNFAKKIALAQHEALKNKDTLVIYETYRPSEIQKLVGNELMRLAEEKEEVYNNIINGYWQDPSWFINLNLSNHQIGIAMDVSLAKITNHQKNLIGSDFYLEVLEYNEYTMPTTIHELSIAAITFKYPVSSTSVTAWKNVPLAPTMTEGSKLLQTYCTAAGLTPLASEWWHFNDWETKSSLHNAYGYGNYFITKSYSVNISN